MSAFPRSGLPLLVAITGLLAACAVGPDFERPPPPDVTAYESTPLPEKTESAPTTGGDVQSFELGQGIPAEWWKLFHSEPLNELIAKALKTNPDLAAAEAALRQAQENTEAGEGQLLPSIDGGFSVKRQKISGASTGKSSSIPPFTLYNASVSVSYGLDLFGSAHRSIEALGAAEEYQQFALEAARLSLTSNVVTTAITEASLRGQIAATQKIVDQQQKQLSLLNKQFELGAIAKPAVLAQATQVAQTRATLPPLDKQLAQTRHLLSVLAGQFPSEEPHGKFELASLKLPGKLPVSLPSRLVEQRPDVRAAEANLHAASAEIGVATAAMLPQFFFTGDIGSDAAKIASLFAPGTGIWSLAAGITQPLFHGGTLRHQKRAAEAAYDQASAIYRKTVLAAFQDVADSLHAVKSDAETLKAQAEAERAAADSLRLSQQQYKDGAISYIALLTVEQAEQQTKVALVQAQALRYADTVALFAALGGGWWNRVKTDDGATPAQTDSSETTGNKSTPATITNFNHGQSEDNNSSGDEE